MQPGCYKVLTFQLLSKSGWFLLGDWWNSTKSSAFLEAIPTENLIILDLWSEVLPVWEQTQSFYGKKFIWCMLHNFGERSGISLMFGDQFQGCMEHFRESTEDPLMHCQMSLPTS